MSDSAANHLEELRSEAKHARQRLELYRAKAYGPHDTSAKRLRELETRSDQAHERLQAWERKH